jgi:hypothetical protein
MYFKIANICIKFTLAPELQPRTDYFTIIASDYGNACSNSQDFELAVQGVMEKPAQWPALTSHSIEVRNAPDGSRTTIHGGVAMCDILWKERIGVINLLTTAESPDRLFVEFLKIAISFLAIEKKGLPLHSSCVERQGKALAFMGPSEAGKSTIAGLLGPSWRLLNDEFNVLLPEDGSYRIFPTPFSAPRNYNRCSTGSALAHRLFSLEKSDHNRVSDMPFREQFIALASCVYAIPLTNSMCDQMLANVGDICKRLRVQKLSFAKDESIREDIGIFIK